MTMQLMFRTKKGTRCLEWAHYALLRDNVEHYLESSPARRTFKALHAVERVEDGGVRYLRALELRREVQSAWLALARLNVGDSAISLRTHALLSGAPPPFVHGTFKAKANGWCLPAEGHDSRPLAELLRDFVEGLLYLTDGASPLDDLRVTRPGSE
jgi:hypothetical protein